MLGLRVEDGEGGLWSPVAGLVAFARSERWMDGLHCGKGITDDGMAYGEWSFGHSKRARILQFISAAFFWYSLRYQSSVQVRPLFRYNEGAAC